MCLKKGDHIKYSNEKFEWESGVIETDVDTRHENRYRVKSLTSTARESVHIDHILPLRDVKVISEKWRHDLSARVKVKVYDVNSSKVFAIGNSQFVGSTRCDF